ncbi:hypothetical protein ES703_60189 [subsurface metagenome]
MSIVIADDYLLLQADIIVCLLIAPMVKLSRNEEALKW